MDPKTLMQVQVDAGMRLIAMVDPRAVRQTSENVQSCKVLFIDNTSVHETMYAVEVLNKGKADVFFVPQHSIRSLLVVEKKAEEVK